MTVATTQEYVWLLLPLKYMKNKKPVSANYFEAANVRRTKCF